MRIATTILVCLQLAACGAGGSETTSSEIAAETPTPDPVADPDPPQPAAMEAAEPATVEAPAMVHCDARGLMGTCEERPADSSGDLQSNCESAAAIFSEGPCPLEDRFGSCELDGQPPLHVYRPTISTVEVAERICAQSEFVPNAE